MKYSHIALSASAGSGKTFMLSVRFIALILDGARLSDVIALTFTNKAVSEMKERIEEVFCSLQDRPAELEQLSTILELDKEQILKRRDERLAEFLSAELRIFTFDSFFSRILRLFASYLGLRPDFELVAEQDKTEAFLRSLSESDAQIISDLLRAYDISLSKFLQSLETIYSNFSGNFMSFNEQFEVDLMVEFSRLKPMLLEANSKTITRWVNEIEQESDLLGKYSLFNSSTSKTAMQKSSTFAMALSELGKTICKYLHNKEQKLLQICFKYAEQYAQSALRMHQKTGILSFSDVAIYVHKILNNPELKDLFYFRLNSNLEHLLIDEFQDTSILQYEIIRPLVEEITAGIGINDAPKSFFYVGDKKQSIYAFRGANQAVFDLFINEEKFQIQPEYLRTNYRSKKAVVSWCNEVFSQSAYGEEFKSAIAAKDSGGCVKAFEFNKDEYLELILAGIKQLKGDICILVRTNQEAQIISEFLASKGIKSASAAAKALVDDLSVRVLLEYTKYCIFGDEGYLEFVKSVLNESPKKLEINLFENAKKTFMFLADFLGLKMSENLLAFIAQADDELLDNLYEESQALSANSSSEKVSIMTVHKSKGLQFENVICLHKKPSAQRHAGLHLNYDFSEGAWDGMLVHNKDLEQIRVDYDSQYAAKKQSFKKQLLDDELNVIYVAYTRAIDTLIVLKEDTCELPVSFAIGDEASKQEWLNAQEIASEICEKEQEKTSYNFAAQIGVQDAKKYSFNKQIILGQAFHYFCELSDFQSSSLDECLRLASERFSLVDAKQLRELAEQLCACKEFKNLLANKVLIKELAYMAQGAMGRIDLIAYDEDEILIIDYKSASLRGEYFAQLERYEAALKDCDFAGAVGLSPSIKIRKFLLLHGEDGFYLKEC